MCREVETGSVRQAGALGQPGDALHFLLTGKPPELRFHWSGELARKVRGFTSRVQFDVAHIEFGHMGLYLEILPVELQQKSVWMLHDIDWSKYGRMAQLEMKPSRKLRTWLHSRMMRRWTPHYAGRFRRCVTVSEHDRYLLTTANPRLQVDVVPNGVDTRAYQPLKEEVASPVLLFVGNMAYLPCADAVLSFCRDVLPRIRRVMANVEMWIVGINPRPEVRELEGAGVHVTGFVEDVRPYYNRSTVCVVPLRAGGGTRLKILEAMALGRPVVSTSIGSEGLDAVDGEHILIADHPEDFAHKTLRLLTDETLRQSIANKARELVVRCYDWDIVAQRLMQVYEQVAR
jgi:glycosyltransferase involved in cell wall biosynthesis